MQHGVWQGHDDKRWYERGRLKRNHNRGAAVHTLKRKMKVPRGNGPDFGAKRRRNAKEKNHGGGEVFLPKMNEHRT